MDRRVSYNRPTRQVSVSERPGPTPGTRNERRQGPSVKVSPPADSPVEPQASDLIQVWDTYRREGDGHFTKRGLQKQLDDMEFQATVSADNRVGSSDCLLVVQTESQGPGFFVLPSFAKSPRAVRRWFADRSDGALNRTIPPSGGGRRGALDRERARGRQYGRRRIGLGMMGIRRANIMLRAFAVSSCIALLGACSTSPPVEELPLLSSTAKPEWDGPPIEPVAPLEQPTSVEIYLDLSYPMAGFLPPASREDTLSTFHVITQNLAHHMARVYGGTDVTLGWRGIGQDLRELPGSPRLTRDLFTGRSTRLDLSIGRIVADFKSGRTKAAALVTDLMATGGCHWSTGRLEPAPRLAAVRPCPVRRIPHGDCSAWKPITGV